MSNKIVMLILSIILLAAVSCSSSEGAAVAQDGTIELRLGYFPNITHSQPLVGLAQGAFDKAGPNIKLETKTFNAGPSAIEALFAGAIDATYIGPNPAINGYVKSSGKVLRIVAGATSGGASFIVRPDSGIQKAADLAGKKIATPQLGNTQDVALRGYLLANGLNSKEKGGTVNVIPTANPDIMTLFQKGQIAGAWVPEPWATRLINEAGGKVFMNEQDLWPGGDFVTTHLIVRKEFLDKHPEAVEALVEAHVGVTQWINANPEEAKVLVNEGIREVTGAALPQQTIDGAWKNLRVTYDPVSSSLHKSAANAFKLGFLGDKDPDLTNIYDLSILSRVLDKKGLPAVGQ